MIKKHRARTHLVRSIYRASVPAPSTWSASRAFRARERHAIVIVTTVVIVVIVVVGIATAGKMKSRPCNRQRQLTRIDRGCSIQFPQLGRRPT